MPLEGPDHQHIRAAHGYIELSLFEEANAELEEIDPFCRHLPEVLVARLAIYHGLKKWELLAVVAKKLAEWNPQEPGFFVELAYATRRADSIYAAHAILTRAADLHPTDGTIQFNLACYESQLGNLDQAKAHLTQATKTDAKFSRMALDDSGFGTVVGVVRRKLEGFVIKKIVSGGQTGPDRAGGEDLWKRFS